MAVLRSGILGRASGKVAGVVGGHWKDKSYIREYVIPANPNTTPQQVQRTLFSTGVAFLKALVGPVMNVYVDKFQKSMSGFNAILGENMALFTTPITFATIKIVLGKLWGPADAAFHSNISHMTISWTAASYGNNGAATDKVYAAARDETTGLWYFASAEVARSTGTISIALPDSADNHVIDAYIWTAKYSVSSPTLLEMVSDSAYVTGTYLNAP